MKNYLSIFILLVISLSGCNPKEKQAKEQTTSIKESPVEIIDAQEESDELTTDNSDNKELVERFFPKTKESERLDTLIQSLSLEISIVSNALDSYVVNEFKSDGTKHVDKYRDFENHLIIKKEGKILVDTVFTKQTFSEFTNKEFLDIANFHGYWFNKVTDNTVELFGVISKPETDWTLAFYHYVDLTTSKFTVKEHVDEEI